MSLKFAVIGDPIAHSLSPAMQNAALKAMKLDAEYTAYHVLREDLGAFAGKARNELAGFNITVPHKNAVIPFLDSISDEAKAAGSVNTVTVSAGKLHGDTTDGYGLEKALSEAFGFTLRGNNIAFLGCGGAAHSAAVHFALCGAKKIFLLNRTVSKAEELGEKLRRLGAEVRIGDISDKECVKEFLNHSDAAVQCTSLGLRPDDPPPFDLSTLPEKIFLYDTIYKPTPMVMEAKKRGIPVANGLGMLLHQGARSLSIWTGLPAPVDVMRRALEEAYRNNTAQS